MRAVAVASVLCLALALAGVGGAARDQPPERPIFGGTLVRETQPAAELVLDPATAQSQIEREMAAAAHSTLLGLDRNGRLFGQAVESWSTSDDGLNVTLVLRESVFAADGAPLSGADVIASLHRLLRVSPGCPAARILSAVQGAEDFLHGRSETIEGLLLTGDGAIEIRASYRQPLLLHALADVNTAPLAGSADPGGPRLNPGAGPFYSNGGGALVPNLRFFRGRPYLDLVACPDYSGPRPERRAQAVIRVSGRRDAFVSAQQLSFPGRRCVYLAALTDAARSPAVAAAVNADNLVTVFFGGSAERLDRLVPAQALPADVFSATQDDSVHRLPGRRLTIGYPAGNEELRLVADRVRVDLLLAGISARVAAQPDGGASASDMCVVEHLVSDAAPAYSVWILLCRLAEMSGDRSWARPPEEDAVGWLVLIDQELRSGRALIPLYSASHCLWTDGRARGLVFRPDGTLDYENAWVAARGSGSGDGG